ncbi:hypothetical protein EX30DRAFT_64216 [Ascodesmis nigricans]|uniref:Ribosomal protein s17 n=1 Tax=Ascodesmis nigricans TaxID=341454 RepID=A0A4S2MUQ8_9PEZI|nr:hypothetical protein EX30DRAFT_64216 [Ascodesmis nigricans]
MVCLELFLLFATTLATLSDAYSIHVPRDVGISLVARQNRNNRQNNKNNNNNNNNNNGNAQLTLQANNIQSASKATGQNGGTPAAGQSNSLTDDANFINFCSGKQTTNGQQVRGGSCNGIVMGDIPSQNNMISTIILNPKPGENLQANKAFDIQVRVNNLVPGAFTNPDNTYYAAPQTLQGGKVVGHTHVTIQSLGTNIEAAQPPDAKTFVFFKGINDNGNGQGVLSASVADGLPAGNYRVCTLTSSSNHQPVLMPVAQRGAQDDCTKFTVGASNNGNNNNNGDSNNNGNQNGGNNNNSNTNVDEKQQDKQGNQQGNQQGQTRKNRTRFNRFRSRRGGRGRSM